MTRFSSPFGDCHSQSGRALLREQYRSLRDQIPVMYVIMTVNSASLSVATYGTVPPELSVGWPLFLCCATFFRMYVWLRRRRLPEPAPADIQRALRTTFFVAMLLAIGFAGWGLALFPVANLVQRTCIAVFIFTAAISCC